MEAISGILEPNGTCTNLFELSTSFFCVSDVTIWMPFHGLPVDTSVRSYYVG